MLTSVGDIESADLDRFRGSLHGAEGSAQNLDSAREYYKSALRHASKHSSEAGKQQLRAKITFSWLFTELNNRTGCERSTPVADSLSELLVNDPDGYNRGVNNASAHSLLEAQAERCG